MRKIAAIFLGTFLLVGCQTTPPTPSSPVPIDPGQDVAAELQKRLDMEREPEDLGFSEKAFDSCEQGLEQSGCDNRVLTVIHFQLMCRDSQGTVQEVPTSFAPLTSGRVLWRLAGRSGYTKTDHQGFGQLKMLSTRSMQGKRLTLRIGKQFMGFTASDLTKVVLPSNFCS